MTPPNPVLEVRHVYQRFGKTEVLGRVNLSIQAGERVAIIGPNGAGKSTLFDVISGRRAPTDGEIWLHGQPIHGKKPFQINRLGLSRSFQISHLFPQLSVLENLRCSVLWSLGYRYTLFRFLSRMRDATARAEDLLQQLHLTHRRDELAMHLPYAEQRALELGITLGSGASVLLLDEPTAGMNAAEVHHFVALIRQVTEGKTLLVVEHDMGVVFDLADKIAVLVHGQVIAFDTPAAVRANPQVQEAYLGALIQRGEEGAPC